MTANPASGEPGDALTLSYTITNAGKVALSNVLVTDADLGTVGTISSLARGASATLEKATAFANDGPFTFFGTASGSHGHGTVTATANVGVTVVLGFTTQLPKTSC